MSFKISDYKGTQDLSVFRRAIKNKVEQIEN